MNNQILSKSSKNRDGLEEDAALAGIPSSDFIDVYVGKRVRLRRTIVGLSQEQLAQQLGISFQQVQKYEHGTNRISASRLYEICRVLNVPVSFFFQGIEDGGDEQAENGAAVPSFDNTTLELIRNYWRINAHSRQHVLDLIKTLISLEEKAD